MRITTIAFILTTAFAATAADLKPVPVGGVCGGNGQDVSVCESNLECVSTTGSQGICKVKESDVGGECKQNFMNSAVCKAGLVCVDPALPADGIPRPGTPGTCVAPLGSRVPVGGVCGGSTNLICDSNLLCVAASGIDGAQGVCKLRESDVGGECKQNFMNSAVCKPGLVCVDPALPADGIPRPGTPGTCQVSTTKPSPVGGVCGGSAKAVCESNLDCITASGVDGAQGICALKQSDVGGQCKQVFPNSAICKQGLVCVEFMQPVNSPPLAGAPGTCQLPSGSMITAIAPTVPTVTAPINTRQVSSTSVAAAITTLTKISGSSYEKIMPLTIVAFLFSFF
ncbi:hypothetical protein BCR33DRAFT_856556 [Rhizoclosmatium globosum]|uniref:IGFBP N-terminal domain-containing protein n=1 Tax=Rhizoclosmatium globosum TaxID=329046 RepID=A0A1Y2BCC7_9FUNG|nr:hypothetical protein BCR33DRAFT_856556 [Rhizoclosmatium globosum]|eukprot:ORY32483.1 hypothetical protein BCR33DRAFT_856556 [Rhizoclosmatium globosum]